MKKHILSLLVASTLLTGGAFCAKTKYTPKKLYEKTKETVLKIVDKKHRKQYEKAKASTNIEEKTRLFRSLIENAPASFWKEKIGGLPINQGFKTEVFAMANKIENTKFNDVKRIRFIWFLERILLDKKPHLEEFRKAFSDTHSRMISKIKDKYEEAKLSNALEQRAILFRGILKSGSRMFWEGKTGGLETTHDFKNEILKLSDEINKMDPSFHVYRNVLSHYELLVNEASKHEHLKQFKHDFDKTLKVEIPEEPPVLLQPPIRKPIQQRPLFIQKSVKEYVKQYKQAKRNKNLLAKITSLLEIAQNAPDKIWTSKFRRGLKKISYGKDFQKYTRNLAKKVAKVKHQPPRSEYLKLLRISIKHPYLKKYKKNFVKAEKRVLKKK
jgi:hypothetical protein